uniref:Uncharacterized protein n=1 Tax=Ditylum brightwellii TaxID=49249 RepID=A0A6S8UVZ6_9STRA|mmetsp:Transcript_25126/g.33313  ORF Transcript_25126/g.33313 Transcript_25126/m.33313 type:complete len:451 (-) Transcript_25126:136-1488(-)
MSESGKKGGKAEKTSPSCAFGSLPTNISDIPQVTSAPKHVDIARSVGTFSPFASAAPMNFGPPSFGPPTTFPSSFGAKQIDSFAAKPVDFTSFNEGSKGVKASPVAGAAPVWNITEESLPKLPDFHPLERTAVFMPHTLASVVATRVSECLAKRSITAEFNDVKARAKCVSPENVEFRVRLYRGKGKFDHGVIVEVQRRYGFSATYTADVNAILDAAEGKPVRVQPKLPPPVVSDCEDDEVEEKPGMKRRGSMVAIASNMLKKNKTIDSTAISMRSLETLTNASTMGKSTALRVSTEILSGDEEGNVEILETIMSLLLHSCLAPDQKDFVQDEDTIDNLRLSAMTILANVAVVLHREESPHLEELGPSLAREVLPVVLMEIEGAELNTRMSVQACRFLNALTRALGGDPEILPLKDTAFSAVSLAKRVGQLRHAALAKEADECMAALEMI